MLGRRRQQHVGGQLHVGRSRAAAAGDRQRLADDRFDQRRVGHRPGPLGDGAGHGLLLDVLHRAAAAEGERRAAAEDRDRDAGGLGVGQPGHGVGEPGPGGHRGHAGPPGAARPGLGHVHRAALVAGAHRADAEAAHAVHHRGDVPAGQEEHRLHARVGEDPGDRQPAVVVGRPRGLGGRGQQRVAAGSPPGVGARRRRHGGTASSPVTAGRSRCRRGSPGLRPSRPTARRPPGRTGARCPGRRAARRRRR